MSAVSADDDVKAAIASVHNDASGVEWTVIGFKSKTELVVVTSGTGGLEAVTPNLPEDDVAFAIIRYPVQIDRSANVRFAFVDWTPDRTHPLKKSFISTQKGNIKKLFEPYHVDLLATDNSDLDEGFILKKLGAASGTLSNVVDQKSEDKPKWVPRNSAASVSKPKGPSISSINSAVKISFVNEDEFKAGLAAVRDATSETTWFLSALNDKLALEVLGSGSGTVEDLLANVREGTANYGVVRVVDVIDRSTTLKFAYIVYMPEDVPPMKKGKINTISGNIKDLFAPVHVDFFINTKEEISQDAVVDKVQFASGSKSHVKN
eukprot:TRINITY_DN2218_c0_g1_i1.p1 TRINITY_DN2218_c0_g1~~TRINITY_DN2218_c0_g1_i1.p1  ORF type:complete len:320 (+),score=108.78 TRINITY_DN2218_c0_g1_i1:82-1041(+)